jgi:hypothetical protein
VLTELLWAATARAQEADEAQREADLFGGPPAEGTTPPSIATPEPAAALDRADATLTGGGRLWWRVQGIIPDAPEGPGDVALTSPSLLDLFVDARPNDRVRAYARARTGFDASVEDGAIDPFTGQAVENPSLDLDQAWLKFDVGRRVFATVGRQRVKWGVGRFFNPTDFLNQAVLDPLAVDDLRGGVDLVRLAVPVGASNLVAVGQIDGAGDVAEIGGAARAEVVGGSTEATATVAVRDGAPLRLGADLSTGVWLLDVRVEAALLHGGDLHTWKGSFDLTTGAVPRTVDLTDEWLPAVVAGVEATFKTGDEDSVSVGAEAFWQERGLDDAELIPWLIAVGEYQPFSVGALYGAAYAVLPCPGTCDDHRFVLSALANLSDETGLVRFDWRGTLLTWLSADGWTAVHAGPEGGEFRFAADIAPVPGVPGLEEGLVLPAPRVSCGGGLAVRF